MTEKTRLLVRVDDAGSSWESNIGCLRACTDGIARSIEVMMPCAWVLHAADLYNTCPEIDIGIHLTLTSEWDRVKWRPLTQAESLVDAGGNFLPLLRTRPNDDRPCLSASNWSIDDIAAEFRAQIELGVRTFHHASHISSHMLKHFAEFDPRLGEIIADLCREFDLKDDAFGHGLPRFEGYNKFPRDSNKRKTEFIARLAGLTSGTHIFIDHPAVESRALDDTGHPGYEDVQEDRVTCLQVLTDKDVAQAIDRLGIEVIGYKDL